MFASLSRRATAIDNLIRFNVLGVGRIALGLLWLANLHWKVPSSFGESSGGGLYKYSASVSRNSPFGPFTWLTEQVILPNFQIFGWIVLIVETALASLLLIGYRTKIVALAGAAMTIPILLSVVYYDQADEWSWSYVLMFVAHLFVYASDAGEHLGLDGVLRRGGAAAQQGSQVVGVTAVAIGALGLFVARSVSFAGKRVALLGSDAGFVGADGEFVHRWEMKFVWFNPLWALLTIALGALVLVGARRQWAARAAVVGFGLLAAVIFALQKFDYVRDDGDVLTVQAVSTASNAAMWGGIDAVSCGPFKFSGSFDDMLRF